MTTTHTPMIDAPTTHFIAGEWTGTTATFDDLNPYDGRAIAHIADGGHNEAQQAVDAAAAAFPAWAAMAPGARQELFLRAAEIIERRRAETVRILAIETGCSATFANFQVSWSSSLMRQAANWGYLPQGDVLRSDVPGRFAMAVRKPLGVVAGFTPWNGAFNLAWRTFALPMAFGNTVVVKPSEEAPISAGLLHAEILREAGFPEGTLNVVTHAPGGAAAIAEVFFTSRTVRCINFTGSDRTGRVLAERAGRALKPIVLELGGYNPLIVLADAQLDNAVDAATFGAFIHQGQVCMCTRKIYVERTVYDEFIERFARRAEALPAGDPLDPTTLIGPLINEKALAQVEQRVRDAVDRGARLVTGGAREGNVYLPTILADVPQSDPVANGCEETFGPVVVVEAVDDAEEALVRAQDTPYGLSAAIMTGDQRRGLDMAQRFDTGIIHVNSATMAGEPSLPNGGVKDSGWGRSGHYAIEDFTEIRLMTLTSDAGHYPF